MILHPLLRWAGVPFEPQANGQRCEVHGPVYRYMYFTYLAHLYNRHNPFTLRGLIRCLAVLMALFYQCRPACL